jgi:NitT/TauT family transport system ATP-binding protein
MTAAPQIGAIEIHNVSKVYDPKGANVLAVDNCSVNIEPGEFCVIVGPSGCGKTTLLNAIAGFHDITSGEIKLDGTPICTPKFTAEPGADRIVVFQNGALFPWSTVLNNVAYGPTVQGTASGREAKKKAQNLLAELGLSGIGDRYPNELSSGMRRRVEIARALITHRFPMQDAAEETVRTSASSAGGVHDRNRDHHGFLLTIRHVDVP